MTFWSHVEALRRLLLSAGAVLAVATVALFCVMPSLFDSVILAPTRPDFFLYKLLGKVAAVSPMMPDWSAEADFHVNLINIKLASQFFIHMSSSFWLALVLSFPIILWLIWKFVTPALYANERKGVGLAFFFGCLMFYLGVAVGYALVFPLTLRFLAGYQVSAAVPNQISLDSYMDNFLVLILVMGLIFEMPLVAWLLGKMGVITRNLFSTYRRHAIAGLLVLAAVVTPTGDPFTLMVVFLPLYALWEASALTVPKAYVPVYQPSNS